MNPQYRIAIIHLLEKMNQDKENAKELGLENVSKRNGSRC